MRRALAALMLIAPIAGAQTIGSIERLDPAFDVLVPRDAKI